MSKHRLNLLARVTALQEIEAAKSAARWAKALAREEAEAAKSAARWERREQQKLRTHAYYQQWYVANKTKVIKKARLWREKNLDRAKAVQKAWQKANKDAVKAWRKANPGKWNAYIASRRASKQLNAKLPRCATSLPYVSSTL